MGQGVIAVFIKIRTVGERGLEQILVCEGEIQNFLKLGKFHISLNPKHEILNPKQTLNYKFKCSKHVNV